MKSFYIILSLATSILAQQGTCPGGGTPSMANGQTFCCPSNFISTDNSGAYCVLGCTVGYEPCFPFCTADGTSNAQTTKGTCTSVPVTASDYSSLVGYGSGATGGSTTTSSGATASSTASSAAATNSAATQGSSATLQGGSTSTPTPSATSSTAVSKGMAAIMTAAPLLMAGALAGAVFV